MNRPPELRLTAPSVAERRRLRRRRRLYTRTSPLMAAIALFALAAGIALSGGPDPGRVLVTRYVRAWQHGQLAAMYALLDRGSRHRISAHHFAALLHARARTATLTGLRLLTVGDRVGDYIPARVQVSTRAFGSFIEELRVPLSGSDSRARVHFSTVLLFPGLRPGERLHRQTMMSPRGRLLAADGTPLAQGPHRTSPDPAVAAQVVGTLGPIPAGQRARDEALGYPAHARVGIDGLELIFQQRLAGTPGGTLLAGHRMLARSVPIPAASVRTTIEPTLEHAAIAAMGSRLAGIVAMDPATGAVEALAGIATDDVQPPGSTMKIITVSGVLTAGLATPATQFPFASSATIDGYTMQDAGGETCGGTLIHAFATSCNSVFAPLGARLGGPRLVAMAERYGFNQPPSIPGASESSLPSASTIGDALAVGSSAIGQGKVLASPLEMTDVAATIANRGARPIPTLAADQRPRTVPVVSARVAAEVQQMMIAVVRYGTGTPAQIPGVVVAGKTGTAELTTTQGPGATDPNAGSAQDTDSWFVGYAPASHPRIVVGALFPNQGAGAATAAPAVRQVLRAALRGR